jgi:hypothetical protein
MSMGCGDETYYADPEPNTQSGTLSSSAKRILDINCKSCHPGESFLTNYNDFKSRAVSQIRSGNMPQGFKLFDDQKQILLSQ